MKLKHSIHSSDRLELSLIDMLRLLVGSHLKVSSLKINCKWLSW
jgi:hypothetical protein